MKGFILKEIGPDKMGTCMNWFRDRQNFETERYVKQVVVQKI